MMEMHTNVYVLTIVLSCLLAEGRRYNMPPAPSNFIGAICDSPTDTNSLFFEVRSAFMVALQSEGFPEIDGDVMPLAPMDALEAGDWACELMKRPGLTGIIAPFNRDSLQHVQAVCDLLDVPLLVTQQNVLSQTRQWTAINLFPHHSAFTKAVIELIKQKGWTTFTIIYEEPEGLERLTGVLELHGVLNKYTISVRQLPEGDNYRSLLLVAKESKAINFVVDCSVESASKVLEQAQQVGIISEPYGYIFTSPDLQTLDLDRYSHGGANITGFRIFDPSEPSVINFAKRLEAEYVDYFRVNERNPPADHVEFDLGRMPATLPLIYDAVRLQAMALKNLSISGSTDTLDCEAGDGLTFGSTLINHMRTIVMDGLTGEIKFDEDGNRSFVLLEVIELAEHGKLNKIGNWSRVQATKDPSASDRSTELIIERQPVKEEEELSTDSMKRSFTVLIALTTPYGMRRESIGKLKGNDRYEGFCVELIDELSKILGFNYTFEVQDDGKYGTKDATTGEWDGMMRKVMDGEVDFAITDLTITAEREGAVDFTTPFMNLGISILFRKPDTPGPDLFSFLLPFSTGVWFSLGCVYLGCSFLLYLLGRICPDEWQNPYPCVDEPEALENQFTLANALWFNLGSVLLQGSEIAPIAYGTRTVASMWWFFALIITSSYTANLASLLSYSMKVDLIHNAAELADNPHGISYGAKVGGSTYSFFKGSREKLFHKMYEYMETHPEELCDTNDNGTARVLEQNYAFLMESTSIEYLVERQCQLMQVGGLLDNKGYGLAMKKESPYRQKLNLALLNLQEQGKLASMKKKWWKEKRGGGQCVGDDDKTSNELALANVGGVFIVLVVGCVIAVIISFLDMTIQVYKRTQQYQIPFKNEFISELKFVFKFSENEKPLRQHRSSSGSESHRALTLQSSQTSPERDSGRSPVQSLTPEIPAGQPTEHKRNSGHHVGSRRASARSRRLSTIHNSSVRLARQYTKE